MTAVIKHSFLEERRDVAHGMFGELQARVVDSQRRGRAGQQHDLEEVSQVALRERKMYTLITRERQLVRNKGISETKRVSQLMICKEKDVQINVA